MNEESLFAAVLEKSGAAERRAFLDAACADDTQLRDRVEQLLAADDRSRGILECGMIGDPPPDSPTLGWGSAAEPVAEGPGTAIGPYELKEQIGEGGFGLVFVAEQQHPLRRKVALKVIKPGMDTREVVARFEAERQALALMDHPNIATVLDGGSTASGHPYFVMELVRGVSITEYCDWRQLTPRERLELFIPVCQAVQHAHQKGIIHRDLKPSNVLVTEHDGQPVPKVIDFGVAKALDQPLTDRSVYTRFAHVLGTPLYMSPEQAELSGLDVDTRADVYALGVLLYELLTGGTPIERPRMARADYDEMRRLIREEEPEKPSTRLSRSADTQICVAAQRRTDLGRLARLVRGELDWIVMKCLEKDRTRRYQTANGLARDIERYLTDEPVEASPPGAGYRLRKFVKRNKGRVAAAGLVLTALLAGTVGTTWGLIRAERARQDAVAAQLAESERAEGERRAKEEAQKRLAQIENGTQILASLIRDLHPRAAEKEGVTLRVLLDRRLGEIAQRLEGEAMGDPLVVARLQHLLGVTLRELGYPEQAAKVLANACRTQERLLGADDLDTVATKHDLAHLYRNQRNFARAEALYKEVLAVRTARLGDGNPATLISRHHLAKLYQWQGNFARAEALYKEVLARYTAIHGADHPSTLATQYDLATLYHWQENCVLAEALYKEVLAGYTAIHGADHPDTLLTRDSLAMVYGSMMKHDQSIPLLEESLKLRRAKLDPNHPEILGRQVTLGDNYCDAGRSAEGIALIEEVRQKGREDPHPAWVRTVLLTAYARAGKTTEATALVTERVRDARAQFPADSLELAVELADNGKALLDAKASVAAEPLLRESLSLGEQKAPNAWDTHHTRSLLGGALLGQRKYADAEPLLVRGYEGMSEAAKGVPHQHHGVSTDEPLTEALERLVQLYDAWDKPAEAAKWRKVLEARRPPSAGPAKK